MENTSGNSTGVNKTFKIIEPRDQIILFTFFSQLVTRYLAAPPFQYLW
jgi:hypothetical protein